MTKFQSWCHGWLRSMIQHEGGRVCRGNLVFVVSFAVTTKTGVIVTVATRKKKCLSSSKKGGGSGSRQLRWMEIGLDNSGSLVSDLIGGDIFTTAERVSPFSSSPFASIPVRLSIEPYCSCCCCSVFAHQVALSFSSHLLFSLATFF